MQLLVDDEAIGLNVQPDQTLRELARAVCPTDVPDRRIIVGVTCDGRAVPPDTLAMVLDQPSAAFQQVGFHTQPVRSIVAQTLGDALGILASADAARIQAAESITRGRTEEAMSRLQALFGDWRQVQDAFTLCCEAIESPTSAQDDFKAAATGLMEQIKTQLVELRGALQVNDLVLVGDVLRYELEEPFTAWRRLLEDLRQDAIQRKPAE